MDPTTLTLVVAAIGAGSGVAGIVLGWRLSRTEQQNRDDRSDAITLAQVAASISRIDDRLADHGGAIDRVCEDVAYIAGSLGVGLPSRR